MGDEGDGRPRRCGARMVGNDRHVHDLVDDYLGAVPAGGQRRRVSLTTTDGAGRAAPIAEWLRSSGTWAILPVSLAARDCRRTYRDRPTRLRAQPVLPARR